ncbi:MAG TPA: di-heme oxidoredictase family protein [Bacteroidota bacterium]|nr:di-heme oxidoredictase family protein [Bacteroidota bacterium]
MKINVNFPWLALSLGISALLINSCRDPEPFPEQQLDERLSGGVNTVFDNTSKAFGNPFPTLSGYDLHVHELGDEKFEATFVAAPAPVNSGLGPIYNNVSCSSCHHNDGIGIPTAGDPQSSLLVRISMPGGDAHGGPLAVPGFGTQVQDKAVFGKTPEATVVISYSYQTFSFPDGEQYELRAPTYTLTDLYAGAGGVLISPRLAPPVFGLGLLEAVPDYEILSNADNEGNGVHGKPNYVWDQSTQSVKLGRFGWKANVASLLTQVAGAYNQDMGITNKIFRDESSLGQPQYDSLKDDPELPDSILNAVKFYVQTLAVPARRNVTDPGVIHGEQLFMNAGCAGCHRETMTTGVNVAFPALSNQMIHPYTDLLVHDMGPGLADNRPDYQADGQEWRTAPLWGLGLFATVNFPAYYLHDGRARTLIEAIMWHGGEAEAAKTNFSKLNKEDRDALEAFLKSL